MASSSEVGHAKNIANLQLLNNNIEALGTTYNPANTKIKLVNLQASYTNVFNLQQTVNNSIAPYSVAVDARELVFKPLNRNLSKLRKAYKATEGVTQAELEDLMTIIRKLKGTRKTPKKSETDPNQPQSDYSVSQLSYDQRTNNMDLLVALLQNTANYNPNEDEYKTQAYQDLKELMLNKTQKVADAYIPLNNARSQRNDILYNSPDNVVDLANKAKDYIFSILDSDSAQYKAIARIKFRKR